MPNEMKTKVIKIVKDLGLFYGAVDLRYSEKNGYTFFEVNPDGQYLWTAVGLHKNVQRIVNRNDQ